MSTVDVMRSPSTLIPQRYDDLQAWEKVKQTPDSSALAAAALLTHQFCQVTRYLAHDISLTI